MRPIEGPRQGVSVLWVQVGSRNGKLVAEPVHMSRDCGSWASGIQAGWAPHWLAALLFLPQALGRVWAAQSPVLLWKAGKISSAVFSG